MAEKEQFKEDDGIGAIILDISKKAREKYIEKILSFINPLKLKPLKIVVDCGNGTAGPTFDAICDKLKNLGCNLEYIKINFNPDSSFPNGIPNPMLKTNHKRIFSIIKKERADMGIAFDGDFDRCFFYDEMGNFISGEYMIGLMAELFLRKYPKEVIVHDPRVVWNIQEIISKYFGKAVQSKSGHTFMKKSLREHNAIYGGEISAHHYFRDFAYCDSGMIPWLLVAELVSTRNISIGNLVSAQIQKFPSSGEINFQVRDANQTIKYLVEANKNFRKIEKVDGYSLEFEDWRFNIRKSNTEQLIRLNIEGRGRPFDIQLRLTELKQQIKRCQKI